MPKGHSEEAQVTSMEVDDDEIPTLDSLPLESVPRHEASFLNDLKLSDFKPILTNNQIPCEFSGGALWCCQGTIAVHRHEAGRVILEGCLTDDYYRVKELLYQQYANV